MDETYHQNLKLIAIRKGDFSRKKVRKKHPYTSKKYIENAIPYKKPVGRVNLAYV